MLLPSKNNYLNKPFSSGGKSSCESSTGVDPSDSFSAVSRIGTYNCCPGKI